MGSPARCARGFSLIELLQVLVIFSIVMAVVFGLFIQIKRTIERREAYHDLSDRTGSALRRIESAIAASGGWAGGDTTGMTLLDRDDNYRTIRWRQQDSQLTLVGAPLLPVNIRAVQFSLRYLPRADTAAMMPAGEYFEYLDGDRSGTLEGEELARARMVEIGIRTAARGQAVGLTSLVTLPRPIIDTAAGR